MVALGLVTTEHLEGKMAYVVLQFHFWVKSSLLAVLQPRGIGDSVLWRAVKDQVKCYLCTIVLLSLKIMGDLTCSASHLIAQLKWHENWFCSQHYRFSIRRHLGLLSHHGPLEDINNWRTIAKQKACKGSDQHWSGWRISEVQRCLSLSSVVSMFSPLFPCGMAFHFLS